ncbi:hypothetical protein [Nocardioides sp. W7]|uniref:hypothetical protein n=1 Tax=Nocardioides sp. W7 TaxID=2931390 RepID=UPI001FD02499|nr:hypothetical protein [Nocardioides sp. W7]
MGWKDVAKLATGLVSELKEKAEEYRPEAVAAREAESEARAETERRDRLADRSAAGATAELTITLSGGEQGTLTITLPCEREEADGWWRLRLEAPDPVLLGTTALAALSLAVPAYDGPGRYDLADLHRRGETGEIESWEAFDLYLTPATEVDDRTWFVDVSATPPPVVVVGTEAVEFDLPLGSAVNAIRAVGTVRW